MSHTRTHTHATLKVSAAAYAEIREKLIAAGYGDQVYDDRRGELIDMLGLALRPDEPDPPPAAEE